VCICIICVCLYVCTCTFVSLPVYLSVCLSVCLSFYFCPCYVYWQLVVAMAGEICAYFPSSIPLITPIAAPQSAFACRRQVSASPFNITWAFLPLSLARSLARSPLLSLSLSLCFAQSLSLVPSPAPSVSFLSRSHSRSCAPLTFPSFSLSVSPTCSHTPVSFSCVRSLS